MTYEEKKAFVLKAVESGEISQNKTHPTSSGRAVTRLKNGGKVGEDLLDKMVENIKQHKKNPGARPKKTAKAAKPKETAEKKAAKNRGLEQIVAQLQKQVADLAARVTALETEKAELIQQSDYARAGKRVLGFTLAKDKGGYWYAVKRIEGKNKSVYIGKDQSKAESKILAWKKREGIQ